ncbi:hypothetical protein BV25DRAFT_1915625 [Artomyces pyxidatus]|uniref:Uncharacterized protein n=1 Tax=Artomyces pyxidatus TaxID=48021 RepID=A0ACB8T446_9AGAM|nr:hypothetical protein BV25DRAFT_1915625 [Artomyces pyxidatus]
MASFNVSAEDSTPLITFSPVGAWTDTPDGDPSLQSYSAQSYHVTSAQGATATISFNGTGIWLFGAKRANYGAYTVAIDGEVVQGNAQSGQAAFQQMLGGKSGLAMGIHTAVLTNTGSGTSVDVDSIVFETQIGSSGASVTNTTTDDLSPSFVYLPTPQDWTINNLQGCLDNSLHFTQTGGAQAQFNFTGDAVALYGTTSPDHANYTVSVDGATQALDGGSNGGARILHKQTLLYFGSNFGPGEHVFTMTANPTQAGQANTGKFMDVDAITVYSATGGNGTTTNKVNNGSSSGSSQSNSSNDSARPSPSKTGLLVGVIAAVSFLLILLVLLAFLLYRRRRTRRQRSKMPMQSPLTPGLPIQPFTPSMAPQNTYSYRRPVSIQNPFADPERGAPYGSSAGPSRSTSIASNYMDDMPRTPGTSVMRDSYRMDDNDLQVRSGAWANVPQRSARPPMLRLPGAQ